MRTVTLDRETLRKGGLWAGAALIGAWLLSPMFAAQHVEGYTARLKAIALLANEGDFMRQDLLSPAVTEFLYYTRAGTIGLLQLSGSLFGTAGDWDFRSLMILSFALVVLCSIFIARRLGGTTTWSAAGALLLVPSVSEVAFFFNDGLLSAAFAIGAMALVVKYDRPSFYLLAGLLAAAAALCRLDGILLAPAIAGVAWLQNQRAGAIATRWLMAFAGFVLGLIAAALVLKATPIDALLVAGPFYPGPGHFTTVIIFAFFIGATGALLLPVGLAVVLRSLAARPDRLRWLPVLVLQPLIIVAVGLKMSTEMRYIYPLLTPYIALYGGKGLEALFNGLRGPHRRASLAALALLLLTVIVPPPLPVIRDGPRSPVGRLWMPALWWRWENTMTESLRRAEKLVDIAGATPRLLLISTHFNDDLFLTQRLLARGFKVHAAEAAFPGCSGFSVYAKDGNIVAHVRTERQYGQVRTSKTRLRALLIDRSLSCPALSSFGPVYFTLWGDDKRVTSFADTIDPRLMGWIAPRLQPTTALSAPFTASSLFQWPFWRVQSADPDVRLHQLQGVFHAFPLSPSEVETLARSAKAYLQLPAQITPQKDDRIVTFEEFRAAYVPRCKNPLNADWSDVPLCMR